MEITIYHKKLVFLSIALILLLVLVGFMMQPKVSNALNTGTIVGFVLFDDDGDTVIDVSTDSNGVIDSADNGGVVGHFLTVTDAMGPRQIHANMQGYYQTTVSTLTPVTVVPRYPTIELPSNFEPTRPLIQTVDVAPDTTVTVPFFAFGPKPE